MNSFHDPSAYGKAVASRFDELYGQDDAGTASTVAFVHELAGKGGEILELGIGTGRLALPLVEQGHPVTGIEASAEMIAALRSKPGGRDVRLIEGDFGRIQAPGRFKVVLLAFNAIFALPSREAQALCLAKAAGSLHPDGHLIIEAYVLSPEQLGSGWCVLPRMVSPDHVELQLSHYDPAVNRVVRTLVHLRTDDTVVTGVRDTYAWPGELDLLADGGGLCLSSRFGGWSGEPFDANSDQHVSVYEHHQRCQI